MINQRMHNNILKFGLSVILSFVITTAFGMVGVVRAGQDSGTTITVNTTDDELNSDGDCSLREAIRAANLDLPVSGCPAGNGSDTILLSAGQYILTIQGVGENEGLTGDLDIKSEITIQGIGTADTVIDANQIDRVFHVLQNGSARFSLLTIRNGNIVQTDLRGGGGILVESQASQLFLSRCLISDNQVGGEGGGLSNSGFARLENTTLRGNKATRGGAIFSGNSLTLENVIISENIVTISGGGIDNGGSTILTNATISNNTAQDGGGLYSDGQMTVLNTTIANNSTGISVKGQTRLKNTIVANSTSGTNCMYKEGTISSVGHNLESGDTCNFNGPGDIKNAQPGLGPLQDNKGLTFTHALQPGSPAIDTADSLDCPSLDQRGAIRPIDGNADGIAMCDIGAYEYGDLFPSFVFLPFIKR